jgi:hypothetical protein
MNASVREAPRLTDSIESQFPLPLILILNMSWRADRATEDANPSSAAG